MKAKAEVLEEQGARINRIFHTSIPNRILAKELHKLENKAHRYAEAYCNGTIDDDTYSLRVKQILKKVDALLLFRYRDVPIFINGDPRGYALKIDDDYVRIHNLDVECDWGGYGILAPDF